VSNKYLIAVEEFAEWLQVCIDEKNNGTFELADVVGSFLDICEAAGVDINTIKLKRL
jgi:hypothetical protein